MTNVYIVAKSFLVTRKDKMCCSRKCTNLWSTLKHPRTKELKRWEQSEELRLLDRIEICGSIKKAQEIFYPERTYSAVRKKALFLKKRKDN